jgi:hypothetical protein
MFIKLSMCTESTWLRFLGLVAMLLDRDMKTEYLPTQFRKTGKAPSTPEQARADLGLSSSKSYPGQSAKLCQS